MANLYQKIVGIISDVVQLSLGGPKLKDSSGTIQARNAADDAFVNMEGLDPTTDQHFATKKYVDDNAAPAGLRAVRFTIDTTATQASTFSVPANSRIWKGRVEITTAYDNSATITVGDSSTANLVQDTTDNDPATIGAYEVVDDLAWGGADSTVRVAIANTPTVGAGVVVLWYCETPKA